MVDFIGQWLSIPNADLRFLSFVGITVHWWILQFSLGLLFITVLLELIGRRYLNETYLNMSRTFSRVAAVIFAVGAATGTLSEFGLILFWPNLIAIVGKYFFYPFYLEVFAFVAEVVFVYMYVYTWDRVSPRFHLIIGIFAALGAALSALMIVSVSTLMYLPPGLIPGYDPVTGIWAEPSFRWILPEGGSRVFTSTEARELMVNNPERFGEILLATVTSIGILGLLLSPPVIIDFVHALITGYLTTTFTILGVYAWRYLKAKSDEEKAYYLAGMKFISVISLILIITEGYFGHLSAEVVAHYNPEKYAAIEGTTNQAFSFGRFFGTEGLIRFITYWNFEMHLPSWDAIPEAWQPPIFIHYIHYSKTFMAVLLGIDALLIVLFFFVLKRDVPRRLLQINFLVPFVVQIVGTFGWIMREVGRKPWTVYGLIRVEEAVTTNVIPLWVILGVIAYILALGFGLLFLVIFLFRKKEEP
ncbi:MAG: cytochrome ubiquinol oxidase subunit I [Promethearchaeota archaeon]